MKSASLLPTSESTVKSRASVRIRCVLTSGSKAIVPSEISTWRRPSSFSQAINPSTRPCLIATSVKRPTEHDRYPM